MKLALLALVVAISTGCVYRRNPAPEPGKFDEIDRRLSRIEKMLEERKANAPAIEKELDRAQAFKEKFETRKIVKKVPPPVVPAGPHAFLGIKPVQTDSGVSIEEVLPGTAAERAELQAGDLIVSVNGVKTGTIEDLVNAVRANKVGATVTIGFVRGKKNYEVTATLGKYEQPDRDDDDEDDEDEDDD